MDKQTVTCKQLSFIGEENVYYFYTNLYSIFDKSFSFGGKNCFPKYNTITKEKYRCGDASCTG